MNGKQDLFATISTTTQLNDYVAREFANVDPDDDTSFPRGSLDDWDPLEDSQELDELFVSQFRKQFVG